ncbi:UPF0449 protein C19orf25 homolog isoform X2 [Trichosurus vulpecula]|uniref:UPF0449 protein C19orf25 homolog isoform X2 n=1 Tax=Trichosurus vulpecula TaxID=9337 RepID=UPI00186B05B1|nr:UPF0449 protein C19orf25 homolog isoform X2 [Trichosurus vulpecula]
MLRVFGGIFSLRGQSLLRYRGQGERELLEEKQKLAFYRMTSKARKRVVLPTRPSPPTIEQILEDVHGALPSDPVFTSFAPQALEELPAIQENEDPEAERERQYQQSRSYVALNHRLQLACGLLKEKCEELRQSGDSLERDILEMKQRTLSDAMNAFHPL